MSERDVRENDLEKRRLLFQCRQIEGFMPHVYPCDEAIELGKWRSICVAAIEKDDMMMADIASRMMQLYAHIIHQSIDLDTTN